MTTSELLRLCAIQLLQNSWMREAAGMCIDDNRAKNKLYFEKRHQIRRTSFITDDPVLKRDSRLTK
ncbi:hypothetical protein H4R33_007235, partial [Dimargaris cristalligena]